MTEPLIRFLLILIVTIGGFSGGATADDLDVRYGIDGRYRIGRWMPIRVFSTGRANRLEIETLDGDGVRIVQSSRTQQSGGASRAAESEAIGITRYMPAGPQGAPLEVRLFADAGEEQAGDGEAVSAESGAAPASPAVWRTRLNSGGVPISRPWAVAIGDPLGLDAIGKNELLGIPSSVEVSLARDAADLPDAWYGYDGVDLVVVGASGLPVLTAMREAQGRALADWLRGGGRLLVALGERGPQTLAAADWLADLAGIAGEPELARAEPAAIETFIVARDPIDSFMATRLDAESGTVLLAGRGSDRTSLPLVLRRNVGFGVVTVVAADLDAAPFADWKQRDDFVQRILPGFVPARGARNETRTGADVRYSELAGQLRSTLDRFAEADRARFSLIAAFLLIVVGMIGPLDYFLVNRWLGRPWLGWVSFPLTIVAFSAAILLWGGSVPERRVRQVSIIDVEPASGLGRGFAWAQVFSGDAARVDLQIVADSPLERQKSAATLTGPWGYAGDIFGGIQVAGEDVRLPAYALELNRHEDRNGSSRIGSSLQQVPLAPLSSKGIVGRWRFDFDRDTTSDLQRRPGSDLLTGTFINPLPDDVLDGLLIYRNTVFLLPTRIPSGGRIAAIEAVQAKNFRWRLNRRQAAENSTQSEPWNRADDRDLTRLMEIVLFYHAAGGAQYTELTNRTLADLDLSHLLTSDRAILVGRVAAPQANVWIDGRPLDPSQIEADTYVRVVLPVETSTSNP